MTLKMQKKIEAEKKRRRKIEMTNKPKKYYKRDFMFVRNSVTYPFKEKSPVGIKLGSPYVFDKNSILQVFYDEVTNDILAFTPENRITEDEFKKFLKDGSLLELKNEGIGAGMIGNTLPYDPKDNLFPNDDTLDDSPPKSPQKTSPIPQKTTMLILGGLGLIVASFIAYKKFKK